MIRTWNVTLLLTLGNCLVTAPFARAVTTNVEVIAAVGAGGLTDLQTATSLNDDGDVVYIGDMGSGQSLFVSDGTTPTNITVTVIAGRTYGTGPQINNAGQVGAVDRFVGSLTGTRARIWGGAAAPNTFDIIGSGTTPTTPAGHFDILANFSSLTNDGQMAFAGLEGAEWEIHLSSTEVDSRDALSPFSEVTSLPSGTFFRFKAADNNRIVVGSRQGGNEQVRLFDLTGSGTSTTIADSADPFWTDVGVGAGISDDAEVVAFYGNLSAAGATALDMTAGPGIFASIQEPTGQRLVRVADAVTGIGSFDVDGPIGVSTFRDGSNQANVVYKALALDGAIGLYNSPLKRNTVVPSVTNYTAGAANRIVEQGDTITGLSGTVDNVAVYDPVNNAGIPQVAYHATTSSGEGVVRAEIPAHKVILAWDRNAPVEIRTYEIFEQDGHLVNPFGSLPAFSVPAEQQVAFDSFKEMVRAHAQQQFDDSGIEGIAVVNGEPEPGSTVVYFAAPIDDSTLGEAFTGIDRFNRRADDGVVAFVSDFDPNALNPELDAETVTHEAGHALGLRHVNPPGSLSVMDYDTVAGDVELFTNGVFNITEPPQADGTVTGATHNPVYHLKRYVEGVAHDELVAMGIMPGDWDREDVIFTEHDYHFTFSQRNLTLYDVHVLEATSDPAEPEVLAQFAEITTGDLESESFDVTEGNGLGLIAASSPGGDFDIALAPGNPFDDSGLVIYPDGGALTAFLQMESAVPAGFETLTDILIQPAAAGPTGDYNNDGVVNAADYVVWRNNEETTNMLPNDPIGGTIGAAHYDQWVANFGSSTAGGDGAANVPEPAGLIVLAVLLVGPTWVGRTNRV